MLQKLAEHISEAWLHAAEWELRARDAADEPQRQACLRLVKGYSNLTRSYPFVETLESFLLDVHKQGWSKKVEDFA